MRRDDEEAQALFAPLTSAVTQATVTAERSFLAHLQAAVRCAKKLRSAVTVACVTAEVKGANRVCASSSSRRISPQGALPDCR